MCYIDYFKEIVCWIFLKIFFIGLKGGNNFCILGMGNSKFFFLVCRENLLFFDLLNKVLLLVEIGEVMCIIYVGVEFM